MNSNSWEKFKSENEENINMAVQSAKEVLGEDAEQYQSFLQNNEALKSMFSMLSPKDMEKVNTVIKDPQLIKKILSSPKARENLKKILGK